MIIGGSPFLFSILQWSYCPGLIEQDEDDYFFAVVPGLPGCHTQAKSLDELMKKIKEAIELYIEVEGPAAVQTSGTFLGVQVVEI
jgi:predicted RNase H-like HicB family nuclease